MPTTEHLGVFDLTSPKVVVIDPGYMLDMAELRYGGCFVSPCRTGTWSVEVEIDTPAEQWWGKLPRLLRATAPGYGETSDASDWQQVAEEIGQDGGVIGLFDVARFQDASVIPSGHEIRKQESADDPRWLWYRFVCEILGKQGATTVPHGAVVHWDGGMDVHCRTVDGQVVGIRLCISGWPDSI